MNLKPIVFGLFIALLVSVAPALADFSYTTRWLDHQGNPVTSVRAINFVCNDGTCDNPLGNRISDQTAGGNAITVTYPVPPDQHGYATYYYAQCLIDQELMFKPTASGSFSTEVQFTKAEGCKADILEVHVPDTILEDEEFIVTVEADSALAELAQLPNGEPQDAAIQRDFYSAQTKVILEVRNQEGDLLLAQTEEDFILRSTSQEFSFPIIMEEPGLVDIVVRTEVADCKCSSTEVRSSTVEDIEILASANEAPEVEILAPPQGSSFEEGTIITFEGAATDLEDGVLTGPALVWSSGLDGVLGTGAEIQATPSVGAHIITLTATDSDGKESNDQIEIEVIPFIPPEFEVTLEAEPVRGREPLEVAFACSVQGSVTLPLSFTLDFGDSQEEQGSAAVHAYEQDGMYIATCTVTDARGNTVSDSVEITVEDTLPFADFTFIPDGPAVEEEIQFTDLSEAFDQPVTYSWDFGDGSTSTEQNPIHAYNEPGTFAITLTITDADGSEASMTRELIVSELPPENTAPEATILLPETGAQFIEGTSVQFRGEGRDREDGDLFGASLEWASSIDGFIGFGTSFTSSLSVGNHTITLAATDREGLQGTDTITLEVLREGEGGAENQAPIVDIITPDDQSLFFEGDVILFIGVGFDHEDGVLPDAGLVWESDLDGMLGTGRDLILGTLSLGIHTITMTGTDSEGTSTSDSITIEIQERPVEENLPPIVEILEPADGNTFQQSEEIRFEGSAHDTEDGELLGNSLVWRSNRDGVFGTGTAVFESMLSPGNHTVTLTATDSEGAEGTDSIKIEILPEDEGEMGLPQVIIILPSGDQTFNEGDLLLFVGLGTDREDGFLVGTALVWNSNIDGDFGTGTDVITSSLSPGNHTIFLTGTDSDGHSASDSVLLTIVPRENGDDGDHNDTDDNQTTNQPPEVNITFPISGMRFSVGESIHVEGEGQDPEDGSLTGDSLVWESDLDGVFGFGTSVTVGNLTGGNHTISLTGFDSEGLMGIDSVLIEIVGTDDGDGENDDNGENNDTDDGDDTEDGTQPAPFHGISMYVSPTNGLEPLDVSFGVLLDLGLQGPFTFSWDFGDGKTSTGQHPVHTYTKQGKFMAEVTVIDGTNRTLSMHRWITVNTGGQDDPRDRIHITSIRINGMVYPQILPNEDIFVEVTLENEGSVSSNRLNMKVTLFDPHGAIISRENALFNRFRTGKHVHEGVLLHPPLPMEPGLYTARITIQDSEEGITRTRHREFRVVSFPSNQALEAP